MCATHPRYVVDLNRDPSGVALSTRGRQRGCPDAHVRQRGDSARRRRAAGRGEVAERIHVFHAYHGRSPPRSSASGRATATRAARAALDPLAGACGSSRGGCRTSTWARRTARAPTARSRRAAAGLLVGEPAVHVDRQRPLQGGWITSITAARDGVPRVAAGDGAVGLVDEAPRTATTCARGAARRRAARLVEALRRLARAAPLGRLRARTRAWTRGCCATGSRTRHRLHGVQRAHAVDRRRRAS